MEVRPYQNGDYEDVVNLYKDSSLYGGQFDSDRDSFERLDAVTKDDPDSILVCLNEGEVVGTVSLIENKRTAWLFRFAVKDNCPNISKLLYDHVQRILNVRDHNLVLVYSEQENDVFDARYKDLGMTKGGSYTCHWAELE